MRLGSKHLEPVSSQQAVYSCRFNYCFSSGIFPAVFKKAIVYPIFKSGDKNLVSNYRPISILSIFSYFYEKIIYLNLLHHVQPFLSQAQHGFLRQKSCLTNLSVLEQAVINVINAKYQLDIIHIDFKIAFDVISHRLLLHKLQFRFGITGKFLSILADFLCDREQRVVVGGCASEWSPVTSGVIQGSVLGPLLFVLFVDDLPDLLSTFGVDCLLFADDSKIYKQVHTVRDCVQLQQAADSLSVWCGAWELQPNVSKCGVLTASLKQQPVLFTYNFCGSPLSRLDLVNDLGVLFDPKLQFLHHITTVRSRAMQMLGMLYRFININDPKALKLYFTSIVLPIIEYCSPVWAMSAPTNLLLLNRVSSFFARIVRYRVYSMRHLSTPQIFERLGLQSLSVRRQRHDMMFLYDIINGRVSCAPLLSGLLLQIGRAHV